MSSGRSNLFGSDDGQSMPEGQEPIVPARQVRALYDGKRVRVYQAYSNEIADAALQHGTFVPPFKTTRMTWIKPSFFWMMYRSGWGTKPNQERVLAIELKRTAFEWLLTQACLSSFDPATHQSQEAWRSNLASSPVRVQWDPERDFHLRALPHRAIQIGLSPSIVERYKSEWIVQISDVSPLCRELRTNEERAKRFAANEKHFPLDPPTASRLGVNQPRP